MIDQVRFAKAGKRWKRFSATIERIKPSAIAGPILDLGSGAGYFVFHALSAGRNSWGVDISSRKNRAYRDAITETGAPDHWRSHCLRANGENLPFDTGQFSAVNTWYVLEHLDNLERVLRETSRVMSSGGVLIAVAQDGRLDWEGHCKIPWIPFLPKELAAVWIKEFEGDASKREGVNDITEPQVSAILETFGFEILLRGPKPRKCFPQHWCLRDEKDVRDAARRLKVEYERGLWSPPEESLIIHAVKSP